MNRSCHVAAMLLYLVLPLHANHGRSELEILLEEAAKATPNFSSRPRSEEEKLHSIVIDSHLGTDDELIAGDMKSEESALNSRSPHRGRRNVENGGTLPGDTSATTIDDDESRLVKFLLGSYNKEVRPVRNKQQPVTVVFGMAYTQLIDLDEKNQVLVSNVWIRMMWYNHLLTWNKSDFGNIESINLDPSQVWLPDIVLYNNADETLASAQMDQFKTKVILRYDGLAKWFAPTILRSRCGINVEFFPFDDQVCTMRFLSWTYDGFRVDIQNSTATADLASYMESGEFELISSNVVRDVTKYSCCVEPYPHVTFTIHIRRKTLFYFNNLIVPCFLITALGLLTFILPPATGERVTLVITTLLAMTVFMLMIAEKTPTTSKVTPLIGKFFIASMVIIGLSLIATCVTLNLYECSRSPDTVPRLIRIIVLDYLAPFLRVQPPKERTLFAISKGNPVSTVVRRCSKSSNAVTCSPQANPKNQWSFPSPQRQNEIIESTLRQRNVAVLPREISDGIAILGERARQQDKLEALAEEWQAVAKVADRLFLIIFLMTMGITTLYIFFNKPASMKDEGSTLL